jgi:O-antigen/teichoic acid export membrane protein
MSRTQRSLISFGSFLLLPLTTMAMGMFSTPLLVNWLGSDRYGAVRAATDLFNYLLLLELGISGPLLAMLAQAVNTGEQVAQTLGAGIRAYLKVLMGMGIAGLALTWAVPQILSVEGALARDLQLGFVIYLPILLLLPLNPFRLLMDASQRNYWINLLLAMQSGLITGLSLYFAWLGWGITGQFLALLIGVTLFNLAAAWDGCRRYPDLWGAIAQPTPALEQKIWTLNVPNLIVHLCTRVGLMTDTIIVAYFLGAASVVPFVIMQRLPGLAQGQLLAISLSTWPGLAELHAQRSHAEFNRQLSSLMRFSAVLGLAILIPIAAYNGHFVTLWMGSVQGDWVMSVLIASNCLLRGLTYLWESCFTGTGNFAQIVPISVVSAIANLAISLVATQYFGIVGPLLGTGLSLVLIVLWWMPKLLQQTFGTSPQDLWQAIARPFAIGIPYGAIVLAIATHHMPLGWLGLISEMVSTALLFLILSWQFSFTADEQMQWRHRFTKVVPKLTICRD